MKRMCLLDSLDQNGECLRRVGPAALRKVAAFALLSSLLFAASARNAFSQTRPRRAGQTTETEKKVGDAPSTADDPPDKDGQEEGDVVRTDTTLVTVPVSVIDRDGRYISDLRREDFHIYEDGVEQEVAYFGAVEKPFTVILMLDTSASTWSKLGQIRDAARVFVEQLRPEDRVMVVSFAMGVKVQCEATSDRQKIRKAIDNTGRGLSTHLYDAMAKLMGKHLKRIQGRKAVVLFTDGVDATSNDATYESTVRAAEELDALIYPIRYDTYDPSIDTGGPATPQPTFRLPSILRKIPLPLPTVGNSGGGGAGSSRADYDRGERYLRELAELTGGQVYEASKDLRHLQDAFTRIAAELGRQYSVGYYPAKKGAAGELRQIEVRVDRADVAVRARTGYVYKDDGAAAGKPSAGGARDEKSTPPPVLQKRPLTSGILKQFSLE